MSYNDYRGRRWLGPVLVLYILPVGLPAQADDTPSAGERISARRLVAAVLAAHPALAVGRASWQAARARAERADALDDPRLSYTFAPESAADSDGDFSQSVELAQSLPWPGKRALRTRLATEELEMQREDLAATRLRLIAAAKARYADWVYIHGALDIQRDHQALLEDYHRLAEANYGAGLATRQEPLRAALELDLRKHRAITLERKRLEVLSQINTLIHRDPQAPLPPPAALPEPSALPGYEGLRRTALASRPELRRLAAQMRAQQTGVELAQREAYPDFDLKAGYDTFWDRDGQRFSVGLSVAIPLDQSKRRAAVDEARAQRMRVEFELSERAAQIGDEVRRAYAQVEEGAQTLVLYRDRLIPLAEQTVQAAYTDYAAGIGVIDALLGAEQGLLRAKLTLLRTLTDRYRRVALLEQRVGGAQRLWKAGR